MLQILLVFYWAVCLFLSILIIIYQISSKSRATTSTRKNFHLLAIFVYIPGMIYDPAFLYLASGVMLALLITVEVFMHISQLLKVILVLFLVQQSLMNFRYSDFWKSHLWETFCIKDFSYLSMRKTLFSH